MYFHFDSILAKKVGANAAIMYEILKAISHNGRATASVLTLHKIAEFLTIYQIEKALNDLERSGLISSEIGKGFHRAKSYFILKAKEKTQNEQ